MAVVVNLPENISAFFDTRTPDEWAGEAAERLPELLLDHANCELKAASTALGFIYRYAFFFMVVLVRKWYLYLLKG